MRKLTKSPIAWGIIATLAYFLGFFLFLAIAGKYPWKQLDLNEAGDFFAGIFAPLAFVWLVVAVFLQKQELGAQREQLNQQMQELKLSREELKLNREELQLNRQLLQEQSEELKKQSEDIRFQSLALDESNSIKRLENECESIIRKISSQLRLYGWKVHGVHDRTAYGVNPDPVNKMLAADQFAEAAREVRVPASRVLDGGVHFYTRTGHLAELLPVLRQLVNQTQKSDNIIRSFESYELDKLLEIITKIVEIQISQE